MLYHAGRFRVWVGFLNPGWPYDLVYPGQSWVKSLVPCDYSYHLFSFLKVSQSWIINYMFIYISELFVVVTNTFKILVISNISCLDFAHESWISCSLCSCGPGFNMLVILDFVPMPQPSCDDTRAGRSALTWDLSSLGTRWKPKSSEVCGGMGRIYSYFINFATRFHENKSHGQDQHQGEAGYAPPSEGALWWGRVSTG